MSRKIMWSKIGGIIHFENNLILALNVSDAMLTAANYDVLIRAHN